MREADGVVSLVGPGGVGKTRLALAVAAVVADEFEDGCYVVELESIREACDAVPAIVRTLGLPDDDAPLERLLRHVRGRRMPLVLDNFEQVIAAAAEVKSLASLDGLPLALELAAARLIRFGAAELRTRLEASLDALGRGPRDL